MSEGFAEPAYGSASLADLLPSICDGLRVPGAWDILALGESDRVVVLLVDGLGWHQLRAGAAQAPTLSAAPGRCVTTVVPSTTAAALTSLGTGLPPGQHGVVSASFWLPGEDVVLYPLTWRKDIPSAVVAPQPTWWGRAAAAGVAVTAVGPRAYAGGGLTTAALRGADYRGADGPGERVVETAAAVRAGRRSLVYTYWEALDRTAHLRGAGSAHHHAELAAVDRFVADVLAAMPAGSRLVVTADHGVVDCDVVVDLEAERALRDGVRLVAGEPRLRHAYAAPGQAGDVLAAWRDRLNGAAVVLSRAEAADSGYFGAVDPDILPRLGDVIAIARDRTKLTAPGRDSVVSGLIGQHGALAPAEMMVPLLVWDC